MTARRPTAKSGSRVSTARQAAARALLDFETGIFPEDALARHGEGLDRRDRALASALVLGVVRWRPRLDWTARQFLTKSGQKLDQTVLTALRLGLFQLWRLDRIPVSAAVNESVNLAKSLGAARASGLVNAVLRAASREKKLPDPEETDLPLTEKLALVHAHPQWMVERWLDHLGESETRALLAANNEEPPLSLRVNPLRTDCQALARRLEEEGLDVSPAPYAPAGLLVRGSVGPPAGLPGFDDGWFAVQDQSAQAAGLILRPGPNDFVLDGCAGRGGKTLHLAETAGRVVGLDPDPGRLAQIRPEADRLNLPRPLLARGDLSRPPLAEKTFDAILVDAPCSSLGVIRRRPDVKWLKTPADPARLAARQKRLLASSARLVKPGGRLAYAVCTHTPEETANVAQDFLANHPDFTREPAASALPPETAPLSGPDGFVRAWPHQHHTDGFFIALFHRH